MAGTVMTDDKRKALALAVAQIEKSCGKGSIMRLGTDSKVRVESIPTGAINLDAAIGVGGIPRGRITEINDLCGAIVRLAGHHGMEAPRNAAMCKLIAAHHKGTRLSGAALRSAAMQ